MDPDVTLAGLRHLLARVTSANARPEELLDELFEVAELFTALDGWLSRGGRRPADWHGHQG